MQLPHTYGILVDIQHITTCEKFEESSGGCIGYNFRVMAKYSRVQVKLNKWKNHFSEMKGDVGMSPHEKEGEQEDAYTKTRNSFITPSLHLC